MKTPAKSVVFVISLLLGWAGWKGVGAVLSPASPPPSGQKGDPAVTRKIRKTDAEWKTSLSPGAYRVMFQCGTEPPFSGTYDKFWEKGSYACAACGAPLFSSEAKYDHGTGWPSFSAALEGAAIETRDDFSLGLRRVEVRCELCGAHLGHVFDDGPAPSGVHYCINSAALVFRPAPAAAKTEPSRAAFAAGCFWGIEYKFSRLPGVLATRVGYSGGRTKNPTYEDVCSDDTGHAETVEVTFDPAKISYEELVRQFFGFHDPTQLNRQGPDRGTQYRSVIFVQNNEQRRIAEKIKAEIGASGPRKGRIVTEIADAGEFYPAEEYHQKYYEKNKRGACSF